MDHKRLTRESLLAAFYTYGRPRAQWLVGAELERHILDRNGRPAPYDGPHGVAEILRGFNAQGWRASREGAATIALTRGQTSITLEPGGQIELSGAPFHDVQAVLTEARDFCVDLDKALQSGPYAQVALGYSPFTPAAQIGWIPKRRYGVMREHMKHAGTLGHHMMKATAATQATYDFSDEADAARKVELAAAIAPLVVGMFANSPLREGRLSGWKSLRGYVWTQTDSQRTGFPSSFQSFSYERWIDYLLDVPMMFIRHQGQWRSAHGRSFRTWMAEGDETGRFPTWEDWDLHMTGVFPEVRIKKQIEMRMADCVALDLVAGFAALFEGLLYCPISLDAGRAIAQRFERFGTREARFLIACKTGLEGFVGGRRLADWAAELLDVAQAGLARCRPQDRVLLKPLADLVAHGLCPADLLLASWSQDRAPDALRRHTHPLRPTRA